MLGTADLIYRQEFPVASGVTVQHDLGKEHYMVRVIASGEVFNDRVTSYLLDNDDPKNVFHLTFNTAFSGIVQVLEDDLRRFPSVDASGQLKIQNFEEEVQVIASGQTINVINNNVTQVASGVAGEITFRLPLAGDDSDLNTTTVNGVPVSEQDSSQSVKWNLVAPLTGASGIELTNAWIPEKTESNQIRRRLIVSQLEIGQSIASSTDVQVNLNRNESWVKKELEVDKVTVAATISALQIVSLEWKRRNDDYGGKVRNVVFGVRFLT